MLGVGLMVEMMESFDVCAIWNVVSVGCKK